MAGRLPAPLSLFDLGLPVTASRPEGPSFKFRVAAWQNGDTQAGVVVAGTPQSEYMAQRPLRLASACLLGAVTGPTVAARPLGP